MYSRSGVLKCSLTSLYQNLHDPSLVEDPAKDPAFAEPSVDAMRVQKDQVCEFLHSAKVNCNIVKHFKEKYIKISLLTILI